MNLTADDICYPSYLASSIHWKYSKTFGVTICNVWWQHMQNSFVSICLFYVLFHQMFCLSCTEHRNRKVFSKLSFFYFLFFVSNNLFVIIREWLHAFHLHIVLLWSSLCGNVFIFSEGLFSCVQEKYRWKRAYIIPKFTRRCGSVYDNWGISVPADFIGCLSSVGFISFYYWILNLHPKVHTSFLRGSCTGGTKIGFWCCFENYHVVWKIKHLSWKFYSHSEWIWSEEESLLALLYEMLMIRIENKDNG